MASSREGLAPQQRASEEQYSATLAGRNAISVLSTPPRGAVAARGHPGTSYLEVMQRAVDKLAPTPYATPLRGYAPLTPASPELVYKSLAGTLKQLEGEVQHMHRRSSSTPRAARPQQQQQQHDILGPAEGGAPAWP
ncbi:MAG: hypothetical protein WDW36_008107 [Sanguina aurantia]